MELIGCESEEKIQIHASTNGKVLRARSDDVDIVTRQVSLNESDPALLAPTIAVTPAPPSTELFLARKSRFKPSND